MTTIPNEHQSLSDQNEDEGYMLLAVVVLVFLVLLTLSIAAPRMAMALKHDQEVETKHRADQYVRAIRLYYRKSHSYPPSLDVLSQKTSGQRYLRQKYLDPLTGKDDWRLIAVGQNKTKVKGLFGQDLGGLGGAGLGSAAGMQSSTGSSAPASGTGSAFGSQGGAGGAGTGGGLAGIGAGGGSGGSSFGNSSGGSSASGSGAGSAFGSGSSNPQGGSGSAAGPGGAVPDQNATDFKGSTGPIMGVGVPKDGEAQLTVNDQTKYQDWEFLYDPRSEPTGSAGIGGGGTGTGLSGAPGVAGPGTGTSPLGGTPSGPGDGTNPANPINPVNPVVPSNPVVPTNPNQSPGQPPQ